MMHRSMPPLRAGWRQAGRLLVLMTGGCVAVSALAAGSDLELFRDADLALGERLIRESQCDACHIRRVGGNGHSIYNPKGRISTPGALRGMVEYCSTELNLQLFPEEVSSVAAVLQRDHYRFK